MDDRTQSTTAAYGCSDGKVLEQTRIRPADCRRERWRGGRQPVLALAFRKCGSIDRTNAHLQPAASISGGTGPTRGRNPRCKHLASFVRGLQDQVAASPIATAGL